MTSPILQKLVQIPLCRGLTENEAATLLDISEERTARSGEVLFREGDPGDCLYFVLEGELTVTKEDPSGQPQPLANVGEGEVVGEMSLLGASSHRSATVTTLTNTHLLRLPASRFDRLLKSNNVAALKIVYNLAQLMSTRLQQVNERFVVLLDQGKKKQELADFQKLLRQWSF